MTASSQGINKTTAYVKQSGLGVPGSTGGQILRRTSSVFTAARATYTTGEIVPDQMSTGANAGIKTTTGKLDTDLSPGTYSKLFAAILRADFAAITPLTGLSVTIAGSGPTYSVTIGSGSFLTGGFKIGDIIRLSVGSFNAANISKNLIITALTGTVATVMPLNGVALVAEGPISTGTITVVGKKSLPPLTGQTNYYFTFEEWYADNSFSDLFTDVKINEADVSLPATGNATCSFDCPGLGRTLGAAQVLTSPTAVTTSPVLTAVNGFVLINGTVTPITGATIKITGTISPGAAEVGSNAVSDHIRGEIDVSGSFTAKFKTQAMQTLYDAQTVIGLILVVATDQTAAADFITFSMSAVKLFSDSPDDGAAHEIIRTYNFTAQKNGAGGAALANDITIISLQDSLAA